MYISHVSGILLYATQDFYSNHARSASPAFKPIDIWTIHRAY